MTLENRGVPTVVLCTDPFLNSAFRHANTSSFPAARTSGPSASRTPSAGLTPDQVAVRAHELEQAVIDVLTTY